MGHSTIQLTERTYNHVRPAAHDAAAQLAAEYWRTNSHSASRLCNGDVQPPSGHGELVRAAAMWMHYPR
jgi:hypothetical protein